MRKPILFIIALLLCMNFLWAQTEYLMLTEGSDQITMCSGIIYDDGGSDNEYTKPSDAILTIFPEDESGNVSIWGEYALRPGWNSNPQLPPFYGDHLFIYDGADTNARLLGLFPPLGGTVSGTIPRFISTNGPITIRFATNSYEGPNDGFAIHVECISCLAATEYSTGTVNATSAELIWGPSRNGVNWNVEYGEKGFTPGMGTRLTNVQSPLTVNNLQPNTPYEFYAQAVCAGNDESPWMGQHEFRTSCGVHTTIWKENFDEYGDQVLPSCWTFPVTHTYERNGVNYTAPFLDYNEGHSSPASLRFNGVGPFKNFAVSPELGMSLTGWELSFYHKSENSNFTGNIDVGVMSDPSDTNTFQLIRTIPAVSPSAWNLAEITFPEIGSQYKYIAFRYINPNSNFPYHSFWIDDIRLTSANDCEIPANLNTENLASSSVTVFWDGSTVINAWELVYGLRGIDPDQVADVARIQNIPEYEVTGLDPNTFYDIYVRSLCEDDNRSNWVKIEVLTNQVPATVPYVHDFEDNVENRNWSFINNPDGNKWCIGTATNNTEDGTKALYISSSNGERYEYISTNSQVVWAYRDILFEDEASGYELSFNWRCGGDFHDYLRVYIGDTIPVTALSSLTDVEIQAPERSVLLAEKLSSSDGWDTLSFNLGTDYSGRLKRLYFVWRNNDDRTVDPPAAIDNISIQPNYCAAPTGLETYDLTENDAWIRWESADPNHATWDIEYGVSGFELGEGEQSTYYTDTEFHMEGLDPHTEYEFYIRTNCGQTYSEWVVIAFTTREIPCAVSELPIVEGFDADTMPPCWTQEIVAQPSSQTVTPVIVTASSSSDPSVLPYSGDRMIYFKSYSYVDGTQVRLLSPPFTSENMDLVELQFMWFHNHYQSQLTGEGVQIQYSIDGTNWVDVEFIQRYDAVKAGWTPYSLILPEEVGNQPTVYIGFLFKSHYGRNCLMDEIEIAKAPACTNPHSVDYTEIYNSSVNLNWEDGLLGTPESYNLQYREKDSASWTKIQNIPNPYLLTGLYSNTTYEVRIQTDCAEDTSRWSHILVFTTTCDTISQIPYIENFDEDLAVGTIPGCWIPVSTYALSGITYPSVSREYFKSDSSSLKFLAGTEDPTLILTPLIQADYNMMSISFYLKPTSLGSAGTIDVGVMTRPNDLSTFTVVKTVTPTTNDWEYHKVPLFDAGLNQEYYHIAFRHNATAQSHGFYMDSIVMDTARFTVNASAGPGGSITPSGSREVKIGESLTFTIDTMVGFNVSSFVVNGEEQPFVNPYVLNDIRQDYTVFAGFTAITGIADYEFSGLITVYPNPANDYMDISINRDNGKLYRTELYNAYGKLLKAETINGERKRMDIRELSSGIYFLRIYSDEGYAVKKFIKQ